MRRIVACNRHIKQERLPTSRYVFVLRAETAGDTSLLFCLVRIVCTECTFFTCTTTECSGRIGEWIVGGQTPRAWKIRAAARVF